LNTLDDLGVECG